MNAFFALLPEAYTPFDPIVDDVGKIKLFKITEKRSKLNFVKNKKQKQVNWSIKTYCIFHKKINLK